MEGNILGQDSPMYHFLKSRRPDEFSDSTIKKQGKLSREILDYYLNSLTSRSQEKEFETFCRRLAEREICPNLLPQTGPTGGGDSKVDSETYPVSDSITLSWYGGIGKKAANERWAFAISAKKTWKPKCISDIDKIIATGRDYKEIFFITNQYVSDKNRAILEDALTTKYTIGIHILDKTWILEKVFTNHHENIAIDTLHLSIDFKEEIDLGPLDYSRRKELDQAEKEIMDYISSENFNLHLVERATKVAILCKEMELPFYVTKGKFERAINLAKEYGTSVQINEICYQWAWATFWWYNNQPSFEEAYTNYECLVIGSNNFFDIERLTNLWINLFTLYERDLDQPVLKSKTDILLKEYDRLISDTSRRNTSLEARANLIFVRLFLENNSSKLFQELGTIIEEARHSLDFSFKTIEKMISGLSDFYLENPEYDNLFENLIKISENRSKEIDGAKLLLVRGKSFYPAKPYTAIRYLGRSLMRLYKSESKVLLIKALFYLGVSFSKIGLQWAAYGYFINTLNIAFIDYMKFGNVSPLLIGCADNLRKIELQSGLISNSLEWNKLYNISKALVRSDGIDITSPEIAETDRLYEGILGVFFLNLEQNELLKIIKLPDSLDNLDLTMSASALRYMLGYVDQEILDISGDEKQLEDFYDKWKNQPAKDHLSYSVIIGTEETVKLKSKILGCLIKLDSNLIFPCVELSKSILASLEAFMATSILDRIIPRYSEVCISVEFVENTKFALSFTVEEIDGFLYYHIYCNKYEPSEFVSSQAQIKEFLLNFVAEFIARVFIFDDIEQQLNKMIVEDHAFNRSLEFSNCILAIDDLIGRESSSLEKWIIVDSKDYVPLKEITFSKSTGAAAEDSNRNDTKEFTVHYGTPEHFEPEDINYNDIVMDDLINIPLWEQAKWKGMMFMVAYEPNVPPILAPVFSNKTACINIFKKWISNFSNFDSKNNIRCCVIKGVNTDVPTHYKFAFSPNIEMLNASKTQERIIITNRFRLMESEDIGPLNGFLDKIKTMNNRYYLIPVIINSETDEPEILYDYAIRKCHLEVKNAWEIGKQDWWAFTIMPDDKPIIPPMVLKAPVIELLQLKKISKST
jgi:hypothetical protein